MSNLSNMRCASSLSKAPSWQDAVKEVSDDCRQALDQEADLVFAFLSADFVPHANQIAMALCEQLGTEKLLGCTGESLVGRKEELEMASGLSVWTAAMPGVTADVIKLEFLQTSDGGTVTGWPDELSVPWDENSLVVLLADPYTFPADWLLERMQEDRPGVPIFGGMASSATVPGDNRLLLGAQAFDCGAVAVVLRNLHVRSIVSQGCRPIGQPFIVTKVDGNTIDELGGKPAAAQLLSVYDELPTSEKKLMQSGVHLGRVVSEYQEHFEQGDFLVRNLVGMDRDSGSIAIGDYLKVGQTVQFHLRDQQTATDELRFLLSRLRDDSSFVPQGGLLFTCNGRGTRLFAEEHHDAGHIEEYLGIPLTGFFAAGEIGPIGGTNFLHGFTASLAVIGDKVE